MTIQAPDYFQTESAILTQTAMLEDRLDSRPVPPVDPDDVMRVWSLMAAEGATREHGQGSVGFDLRVLAQICRPGSDVFAVFLRAMLVQLLSKHGSLNDWQDGEGRMRPGIFEVAAMYALPKGLVDLDYDAFVVTLRERLSQQI